MNSVNIAAAGTPETELADDRREFARDVLAGLGSASKSIPCKYFYDEAGSVLFEQICEVEEYYPTRTEIGLLKSHAGDIAQRIGKGAVVVEFGSGASVKIRTLLDALQQPAAYLPIDISAEHLLAAAAELQQDYPALQVIPIAADYTQPLEMPEMPGRGSRLGFFPGSTIGNFAPPDAQRFLALVASLLGADARLLIGVDLKKDRAILEPAYDDAAGVTAAFNRNLLLRINRELDADFEPLSFDHRAHYNESLGRIEITLVSRKRQTVSIMGRSFNFAQGEQIHTENSYKYSVAEFQRLAVSAGWQPEVAWQDPNELFSLHWLRAR